jgi:hypothetical protein
MPEHDPTRTDRLALYMRARAAEKAAHDDAVKIVERWNTALRKGGVARCGRRRSDARSRPACRGLACSAPAARRRGRSISGCTRCLRPRATPRSHDCGATTRTRLTRPAIGAARGHRNGPNQAPTSGLAAPLGRHRDRCDVHGASPPAPAVVGMRGTAMAVSGLPSSGCQVRKTADRSMTVHVLPGLHVNGRKRRSAASLLLRGPVAAFECASRLPRPRR